MVSLRSPWLIAFLIVAGVHLTLLGLDVTLWATVTKCLLAPLLAAWVLQQHGPVLLVLALVGCFFGDMFLEFEGAHWFLVGMGAFALAHVAFVTWFVQHGAMSRLTERWWVVVLLLVMTVALVAIVWSGLDAALRIPVPIYALLLTATAAVAVVSDARAGIGALLFLFSDALIALRIADVVESASTLTSLTIMVTYIAAILLLTTGIVGAATDADSNRPRSVPFDSHTPRSVL